MSGLIYAPAGEAHNALAIATVRARHRQVAKVEWTPYPFQVPPPQPWDVWAFVAGRGAGKTDGGAQYVDAHAKGKPGNEGRVPQRSDSVARTQEEADETGGRGE